MATFKSKLIKVLAMTALVFAAFSFTACGPKPGDGSDSGGGSGGGADGSGGGDGGSGITAGIITAEQQAKLDALNGYEIHINWTERDEDTTQIVERVFGEKDNVFWFIENMDGEDSLRFAVKKEGNMLYSYSGTDTFVQDDDPIEEGGYVTYETLTLFNKLYLYIGDTISTDITFEDNGIDTICNRPCKKYKHTASASALTQYAEATVKKWIDNGTGITMKLLVEVDSNVEHNLYDTEVVEFKTGNQVTVPTLIDAPEDGDE